MTPATSPFPPGLRRPSIVQLLQWSYRPTEFMDDCARRFGDMFTVRFAGLGTVVFLTAPELVKQVFTGDPRVLHAGEANQILLPIVGPWSVLVLDEAAHLRQRRLLMPPFHGERMTSYAEQMRDITEASVARWTPGRPFPIYPEMQAITLDVTLPAGCAVGPCMYLTHLRPDLYPEPRRFRPDRWLGEKKADPYGYFPFGGGMRRCIGMAFALYEMKIILATVLSRAALRLPGGAEPMSRQGIVIAPKDGTLVMMDRAA